LFQIPPDRFQVPLLAEILPKLTQTAPGSLLGVRLKEILELGGGEDHGPHVPALGDQGEPLAQILLAAREMLAHNRQLGQLGGPHSHLFAAYGLVHRHAAQLQQGLLPGSGKAEAEILEPLAETVRRQIPGPFSQPKGDASVHGSGVQILDLEPGSEAPGQGGLARARGPVQGDQLRGVVRTAVQDAA